MPASKKHETRGTCKRFMRSVWLFPAILGVLLIILTSLQISGTSVGVYHDVLDGDTKNPSLLLNNPQPIRSDEWLVNTQLTIAQSVAGYPAINHNIHSGTDMSVAGDVPYKDWSAAFRPQNLIFFVLPLTYAFAFKWWLLLLLTMVSCYFVVLRFLPGKRLLAAMLSMAVGLSPFLFWWYLTTAFAPIFYGFFIILIGLRIINGEKVRFLEKHSKHYSSILYALGLGYLLISFALVLYPPYQIPVALCVGAFLLGYMLDKYGLGRRLLSKRSLTSIGIFAGSLVITGAILLLFVHTHSQAVSAVENTVYPGSRQVYGGKTGVFEIFSSYLQPQLESNTRGIHYFVNQSEASSFLLFLPFLLLPGFIVIYLEHRQKRKLNWPLLLLQLLGILFLANLFLGGLQPIYKLFLLSIIPHQRLFIGLGFLGVLQLLLIMKSLDSLKIPAKILTRLAAVYTLFCLAVLLWAGKYVRHNYPRFVHNPILIGFLAVFFAAIIFCFLSRRFRLGALLFLVFSLGCVYRIHPLYRGLGPLYPNNKLSQAIDSASKPGATWVTLDSIYFENAAMLSNRDSLSGVQSYPNVNLWKQVEGPKGNAIYNRYAHVEFTVSPAMTSQLTLVQSDTFDVKFTCDAFIEHNVQFALATSPITESCTKLVNKVTYPALTFYLYRVH